MIAHIHACSLLHKHKTQYPNYLVTITRPPLINKNVTVSQNMYSNYFGSGNISISFSNTDKFILYCLDSFLEICLGKSLSGRTTTNQGYLGKRRKHIEILTILSLHLYKSTNRIEYIWKSARRSSLRKSVHAAFSYFKASFKENIYILVRQLKAMKRQ